MAQRQVKVEGPPPGYQPDLIPCRLPIKDLLKDKEQFSLYILALRDMQQKDWNAKDQLSYWQIASIHGEPYTVDGKHPYVWDTIPKLPETAKPRWWCAHSVATFPTWHRPYVSLYEQVLVNTAIDIVNKHPNPVPNKTVWDKAARNLRAPYWDWAVDALPPPEVIRKESLTILDLDGTELYIEKNPLFSFDYSAHKGAIKIEDFPNTVRHPNKDGVTNVDALIDALNNTFQPRSKMADSMRERIFKLHRDANTWEVVSNDGGTADELKFLEGLEQPHDDIHIAVGGTQNPLGTMIKIRHAGFDPIFMLHHAQVDRQLAIWQTYHYDKWIPKDPGLIRLTPFWDGTEEFNSSGIRNFKMFRYQYPEFVGIPEDEVEARKFMWEKIKALYGPPQSSLEPAEDMAAPARDWFAHVRTPIKSITSSFVVFFFLGSVPENPLDWPKADNLTGTYSKFGGGNPENCANCQNLIAQGIEAHSIVSLTRALKHTRRYNQSDTDIEQYLRDNLQWRIQQAGGPVIEPRELEGFTITVWSRKLKRPGEDNMPMFPDPDETPVFHDVTDGKPGGGPNPIS